MINFLKGLGIGAIISFPVGPIGILCLRRLLLHGPLEGIAAGLGAATADIFYATTALLGLTFVDELLEQHALLVRFIGSLFLCLIGLRIYLSHLPHHKSPRLYGGVLQSYFSTFFLTLANPLIIFTFLGAFAFFQIDSNGISTIIPVVVGIFLGSAAWWLLLGTASTIIHPKLNNQLLHRINKVCGGVIFGLGISGLLSLLLQIFFKF